MIIWYPAIKTIASLNNSSFTCLPSSKGLYCTRYINMARLMIKYNCNYGIWWFPKYIQIRLNISLLSIIKKLYISWGLVPHSLRPSKRDPYLLSNSGVPYSIILVVCILKTMKHISPIRIDKIKQARIESIFS